MTSTPRPTTITILRHGRTEANAKGLLQGRMNTSLDQLGHAQAEAAAALIGPVDCVVSSPLRRAVQTAEYLGVPVETDDRLIELDYGEFDGKPLAEVPVEMWAQWRADLTFRPPSGETLAELGERVRRVLGEIADPEGPSAGKHLVLVSHVSPIKAAVAWALGVDDAVSWRMHLATASITRVQAVGGRPVLQGFNDVSHHRDLPVSG